IRNAWWGGRCASYRDLYRGLWPRSRLLRFLSFDAGADHGLERRNHHLCWAARWRLLPLFLEPQRRASFGHGQGDGDDGATRDDDTLGGPGAMSLGFGDALTALGLVLVIEGLVLAVAPEGAKRAWALLMARPPGLLRGLGLGAMAAGVLLVWFGRVGAPYFMGNPRRSRKT